MRHFLHPKLLRKAREVRLQLEDIESERYRRFCEYSNWVRVLFMLPFNCCLLTYFTRLPTHLHPTSALYGLGVGCESFYTVLTVAIYSYG